MLSKVSGVEKTRGPISCLFEVRLLFQEISSTIQAIAQTLNLYKRVLEKMFDKEDVIRKDEVSKIQKEIEVLEKRKANLQDKFLDNEITSVAFNDMMDKVNIEMARLQNTLDGLQQEMTPYIKYIRHTLPMPENIVEYYRKADGVTKKKILCCIFDEKLVLENGIVAATPFSVPVKVLLNIIKGFRRSEKKKEVESDPLLARVRYGG